MASLTDTEIAVLEMLSKEGRKDCARNQRNSSPKQGTHGKVDEETL